MSAKICPVPSMPNVSNEWNDLVRGYASTAAQPARRLVEPPSSDQVDALLKQGQKLSANMEELYRAIYLNVLLQAPMPSGRFSGTILGTAMTSADFVPLYVNNANSLVALRVLFDVGAIPGVQVYLSYSTDASFEQVIDYLGNSALTPSYNKRISDTILVLPAQTIYIAPVNFAIFPPKADDKFRLRVWDPTSFMRADAFRLR